MKNFINFTSNSLFLTKIVQIRNKKHYTERDVCKIVIKDKTVLVLGVDKF